MSIHFIHMPSPVGPLLLVADDDALRSVQFPESSHAVTPTADWIEGENAIVRTARQQLDEYFAGTRQHFDLPLAEQGTAFQEAVWRALTEIPCGQTRSYRDIATRIGQPAATRAVGAANGRNPLPIVRPCHRVIGADGSLTGFGGGLDAKHWLLQHEGALPVQERRKA